MSTFMLYDRLIKKKAFPELQIRERMRKNDEPTDDETRPDSRCEYQLLKTAEPDRHSDGNRTEYAVPF